MTDTTMVERVARAILKARYYDGEEAFYDSLDAFFAGVFPALFDAALLEASAAIAAMRNPSKVMTDAGRQAIYDDTGLPDKRPHICDAVALSWTTFNAMIDAALNDTAR